MSMIAYSSRFLQVAPVDQVVERQQVADGVAVLGARQAAEGRHVAGLRRLPRRTGVQ